MSPSAVTTGKNSTKNYVLIAIAVLLSCWTLFWMDHETRHISDLFAPDNLAALALYFVPTFFISVFTFEFLKKNRIKRPLLLSFILGIPLGIAILLITFLLLKSL